MCGGVASRPQEAQRPVYKAGSLLFPPDPSGVGVGGSPWALGPTQTQAWVEPVIGMEISKENRGKSGRKWLG